MSSEQHLELSSIRSLVERNEISSAASRLEKLTHCYPDFEEAWVAYFNLAFQFSNFVGAKLAADKLLLLSPENYAYQVNLIKLLDLLEDKNTIVEMAEKIINSSKYRGESYGALGRILCKYQYYDLAKQVYTLALKRNPNDSALLLNLATVSQYLGNIAQALQYSNLAIEKDRACYEAYFFRSHLSRQSSSQNSIDKLKEILNDKNMEVLSRVKIFFSLAKELEDCQQYKSSFKYREQGASLYRSTLNYDINSDIAFIESIKQIYSKTFIDSLQNDYKNDEAIFIVGLPRSGTTLVERIISSHSQVTSEGELTNFNRCLLRNFEAINVQSDLSDDEFVQKTTEFDFAELGKQYIQSTKHLKRDTPFFIDKFPQNSLYVGMILSALPSAKVVILDRHPLDVCYSVYKQVFTDIYHYSYDLEELADYYIAHSDLMNHWQRSFPDSVIRIQYEDIVSNIECETQKILAFLNLPWEEECLDFHNNKQASSTASSSQVRQKLYSSSIGMWKNYQQELYPLIEKLRHAGYVFD